MFTSEKEISPGTRQTSPKLTCCGGVGVEFAAFKQQADDRLGQGKEQNRRQQVDENQDS